MKKKLKNLFIILTTVLLVMTNVGHVFAEVNRNQDVADLEITGLDGGETVDLYQLVTTTYSSEGDYVDHYNLNDKLADADAYVVLREKALYEDGDDIPPGNQVGGVKTPEVRVQIKDLPLDDNGKIKNGTITGKDSADKDYTITFDATTAKVVDRTSGEIKETNISGKLPFSTSAPSEKQISAISADIVKYSNSWSGAIKEVEGEVTVTSTNKKWSVKAYAAADEDSVDATLKPVDKPAIYDATGIYLGRINPAEDSDVIYNPVIVSVGYINESGVYNYDANNVNAATDKYASPSVAAKKDTPDVDKTVTGGKDEKFKCLVVATDLEGNPLYADANNKPVLGYIPNVNPASAGTVNIDPDKLVYVKKNSSQFDVDEALAKTNATAREEALDACTTTNVEEALHATSDTTNRTGALGTKFTYELQPTLPKYPENAVNKTLWFSDKMSDGLDYVEGSLTITLKKSNSTVRKEYNPSTKLYEFYITPPQGTETKLADAIDNEDGFNINYVYDAIPVADRVKGGLVMNYQAVINKDAFKGVKGNPNVVTMKYANSPDTGSTHKTTDRPNDEGNKEKYDKEIVYTYEIYFKKVDAETQNILKDAVFGLYAADDIRYSDGTTENNGTVLYEKDQLICTIQTNNDGIGYTTEVVPGNYYIQEITPPKNYQKNSTKYNVTVSASDATKEVTVVTHSSWEYTSNIEKAMDYKVINNEPQATLAGYLVDGDFYDIADYPTDPWIYAEPTDPADKGTLTNTTTGQVIYNVLKAYVAKETHVRTEGISVKEHAGEDPINRGWVYVAAVPNTKTPELPSTGGIGTYLFTIAGVAIIATAMFMLIFRKREEHNH